MDERIQKQMEFALEIDKEKNIFRQTSLSGHGRKENDAEHAWHMAIMAYQKEREDTAKERIFSLLPEDQKEEMVALFDEFEANETPESKFAHAMDNFQPLILNNNNEGSDWAEHGVSAKQVYKRQGKTKDGSDYLYEITDRIIRSNVEKGNLPEE